MVVSKAPSARTFLCIAVALAAVLSIATKQAGAQGIVITDKNPGVCPRVNEFCEDPDDSNVVIFEACVNPDDPQAITDWTAEGTVGVYAVYQFLKNGPDLPACAEANENFESNKNFDDYQEYRACLDQSIPTSVSGKSRGCGCTDKTADNYNENAVLDYPGFCKKKGCTGGIPRANAMSWTPWGGS